MCRQLADEEHAVEFALEHSLIKMNGRCECGGELKWEADSTQKLGYTFRCSKSRSICGRRYSSLLGTWFAHSKLPIHEQILHVFCFCMDLKSYQLKGMLNFTSYHTMADWQNYFKDICAIFMREVSLRYLVIK